VNPLRFSIVPDQIGGLVWLLLALCALFSCANLNAQSAMGDINDDDIEIIEGEERTIFEYRNNGVLIMIKIVPKVGRPYYMVPADGSAHYQSLDHKKRLYPQWVILDW
jgi:hypothetical protein|tara:strand:- start:1727 stop:2050 length:324 start_codon:yes stop_codon:yes gene_type:complete